LLDLRFISSNVGRSAVEHRKAAIGLSPFLGRCSLFGDEQEFLRSKCRTRRGKRRFSDVTSGRPAPSL
jgi:hypothetical protein